VGPVRPRAAADWRPFSGGLSVRSAAYALSVLGALFRWLIEQRYLVANPFAGVKVRGSGRAGHVFSEGEWLLVRTVADGLEWPRNFHSDLYTFCALLSEANAWPPTSNEPQCFNQGRSGLLRATEATSRFPERDAVILLLGFSVGMRIAEIARITIADVLFSHGRLRSEVSLREAITKGCRQRTVYFTGRKLIDALERYLAYRVDRSLGATLDDTRYRGLVPALPLILSRTGYPYSLNLKVRTSASGEQLEYLGWRFAPGVRHQALSQCRAKGRVITHWSTLLRLASDLPWCNCRGGESATGSCQHRRFAPLYRAQYCNHAPGP